MRIAMIGQKGIPAKWGGVERHVEALAARLSTMGEEVFVYTRPWYSLPRHKKYRGARLISLPSVRTKHLDAITHTFISTLHAIKTGVDIIHYHGVGPALLSWIPRVFAPRIKVVVTFHCIDRNHKKWNAAARLMLRLGEYAACRFTHETIAVSRTLQHYCKELYGNAARYIPNGVEIKKPKINGKNAIKKWGLKPQNYILMVSRLVPHKCVHELIDAFLILKKRGEIEPDFKLVIVGDSAFTDSYVKKIMNQIKGEKNVILTGALSGAALQHLFANGFCVAHPSTSEGMPLVVLEAMAHGKPVLVSDIPEHCEMVRDNGFTFRSHDIDDIARKIKYLLAHPRQTKSVGAQARTYVLARHNWNDIAKETRAVYAQLLAEKKATAPILSKT